MTVGTRGRIWRVLGAVLLAILLGGGALLWMERDPLRACVYVHYLTGANDDAARQRWADKIGDLGEPAVPGLCSALQQPDPRICGNAQAGLAAMADRWGHDDPHNVTLVQTLAREMAQFSAEGQRQTLELVVRWFRPEEQAPSEALVQAVARLLAGTVTVTDPVVHNAALDLAAVLRTHGPVALAAARELVCVTLHASTPTLRAKAIVLTFPGVDPVNHKPLPDMKLQVQVANLLVDSDVEVRRSAILAVGDDANSEKVETDTLLPCLRDSDEQVRLQCIKALGSRRLTEADIRLAYFLTDPVPMERVKVLDLIFTDREGTDSDPAHRIEPADWMCRLSRDPAPSVRAAAIRAMARYHAAELTKRLAQMADSDPDGSVRYLADYYLRVTLGQTNQ